jgi:hypothetical protein
MIIYYNEILLSIAVNEPDTLRYIACCTPMHV